MKKISFIVFCLTAILFGNNRLKAQHVNCDMFLQGHWLEACVAPNGAWGNTTAVPASYHPHSGGSTYYTDPCTGSSYSGPSLDFAYNPEHGGWSVAGWGGSPTWGPYFLPGTPFDGWAIQVNGKMGQAFYTTTGFATLGGATFGGSNTDYLTSLSTGGCVTPSTKAGIWKGYFIPSGTDTLKIVEENRVDTEASWDVVTIKFTNSSSTAMTGLYYFVSADPDNDEPYAGSFPTNNHVIFQNDARHRVMVEARPPYSHQDCYSSICTRDCRAQAMIYQSWPPSLSTSNDLDLVAAHTATGMSGCYYTLGAWTWSQDIAYALIYNLGNLAAGDSTIISFAWNFKDSTCTDSAFPDPVLIVNDAQVPPTDTFNSCGTGMTTLPVCLGHASDKDWSWASWTWSPGTGLASTTGISHTIDLTTIPGSVTYTITGNDSISGMHSCNSYVMYLTVIACNHLWATANYPCEGDSIIIIGHSDSVGAIGATYAWTQITGTGGFTSTMQNPVIYPAVYPADTGRYMVIRTNASGFDTAFVNIRLHPKPDFLTACNGDSLCSSSSTADTMRLRCYPYASSETFLWTGPNFFYSTLENPTLTPYNLSDTGWYHVYVSDSLGCWDTGGVFGNIIPPIIPPTITGVHHYCTGETFVPFGIILEGAGFSALWYADSVGGTGSSTAPFVDISYAHTVTVYASQVEGICEGLRGSFTVVVDSTPSASASNNSPICADSTLRLFGSGDLFGGSFSWSGPATFSSVLPNPIISNAQVVNSGIYTLLYTMPTTCHATAYTTVNVYPTPAPPQLTADTPCDGFTLNLFATDSYSGSIFAWSGPLGFSSGDATTSVNPAVLGRHDGIYTVVATLLGVGVSCPSLPSTILTRIWPNPNPPITHDTAYCQYYLHPMFLTADSLTDSAVNGYYNYLTWYTSLVGGSPLNAPVFPLTGNPGTNTWFVMQTTVHTTTSCISPRVPESVSILDSPIFKIWKSSTFACQDSSLTLRYETLGGSYVGLEYAWGIPNGASIIGGGWDSAFVKVKFDSLYHDTVSLYVTDNNWDISCHSNNTVNIKVVPMPTANEFINPIVCAGDTVKVELTDRSDNAFSFTWNFDFWGNDGIITSTSSSTGPWGVRWIDGGTRIVTVIPITEEGCVGLMNHDTVLVRNMPDASFNHRQGGLVCAQDSILFTADLGDSSNYTYNWKPAHFFNENNKGNIWGRVEVSGYITLTVTDPFNCINRDSLYFEINPVCCLVSLPNAFTPNGDGKDDFFRPIYTGFHTFHTFRIQNRWGQTVFQSTSNEVSWDGTFDGIPQDIGVYFYYLKFDCNGKMIIKTGDVTLLR